MKVFVAGGGGYIGIPLCHQLAREGHDVVCFDRFFFGVRPDNIDGRITCVKGDTRNVKERDIASCDAVVDLAGLSNDAACDLDPGYTKSINIDGAINLFRQAYGLGVSRYVYSSSASVYGFGRLHGLTEDSEVNPLTDYARSKLVVERFITGFQQSSPHRSHVVILRNSTVFGYSQRMRFDLAVNAMAARALLEKSIYVMGGGDQWRPFVHVDDVVKVIIWALNHADQKGVSGETFNVGCDGGQMTVRTLAGKVANTFQDVQIHTIPDDVDRRSYHLSFAKLRKAFPTMKYAPIENGIWEVRNAVSTGATDFYDPRTITMQWYKSMLEWDKRLQEARLNGSLL